ncbi:hypothetical protein F5I97DRAFT_1930557 [Phlebopus sp. FC_14]|nr:hypothetical protein F5I97DRAFT_1930557 [Phlebopus sp. FC_14]
MADILWRPDDVNRQVRPSLLPGEVYRPDILSVIEDSVNQLRPALHVLSRSIHSHPELKFEEKYAHDEYAKFLEEQGFAVQRHHHLETAWVATFSNGEGGPVLGVNSEMDALPGIGHACGHNLIGISGVAVACAVKAAMLEKNIQGKIILLGTPGEEGGFGKVKLWNAGAYKEMDICLMCVCFAFDPRSKQIAVHRCHPAPGPPYSISLSGCLAVVRLQVDYHGHTAHAGLSPWQGQNALDAAVLAYTNIGLLRQQIQPTHRVHGIFEGKEWAPNIIPDNSTMYWYVRAPTTTEAFETAERVKACFEAAALATGCTVKITEGSVGNELIQNEVLGEELADVVRKKYGAIDYEWGISSASTDFGNISYLMPGLHPGFSIPTEPGGGNHTAAFTDAAITPGAHEACLTVSKALAAVGGRVLTDPDFLERVKDSFERRKKARGD